MKSVRIKGYEDYELFEDGRVYSHKSNKYKTPYKNNCGYLIVTLGNVNGFKPIEIHRLLGLHFIPNPNNYSDVHHKNENTLNNNLSNLEWKGGSKHLSDHNKGVNNPKAKLTELDVKFIKAWLKEGYIGKEIAKAYKISPQVISRIKVGKIWSHITI